ncbi:MULTISPECIES: sugar porter family MFS transporter [unclassified Cellvibrio]|uniref:sugar porter family MFS transporter n=1 Tax=unclassified Cellvibrio TaxID=2624793 RepID=UPI000782C866|nr:MULTISPECIES: sugar porter family MFS transporter [unclassified Cellvibrio]QEY17003.1 sugar porter family MFS transporter [Cellvibrio sp. KY-GH-1]
MAYNKYNSLGLAILVSLGGFVFGFDASVISGTISQISNQYALGSLQQGLVVGAPTLGAIIAACFVGYLIDCYGRKKILLLIAFLYLVSVIGCAFANGYWMLVIFRFIGGLAFASLMVAPVYIAEISPAALRGKYVSINQLNIVLGFSAAYFSNYGLMSLVESKSDLYYSWFTSEQLWRVMLGAELIPALIYFVLLLFIPESPRWLILNNRKQEASILLNRLMLAAEINEQLAVKPDDMHDASLFRKILSLFENKTRFILFVGIVVSIIQQATGVNAVYFYAPTIFEQSGLGTNAAFAQAIWIGIVNVVFTIVAMLVIDRLGRKPLLIVGLVGVVISMGICGYGFSQAKYQLTAENIQHSVEQIEIDKLAPMIDKIYMSDVDFKRDLRLNLGDKLAKEYEPVLLKSATQINVTLILIGIFGFVAAFAVSLGPVMWVLLSEIFPNQVRGVAMAFVGVINSVVSFAVQLFFPWQLENLGAAFTFIIFGAFAVLGLLFVCKYLPETKGKSLEQLEESLSNKHF